ncbi:hypothetical protein HKCCSP123_06355 [Rhodobacterales bacterium HKCCSP123]|nr:hypothetical protein [Rhodobacterales bacterium HKCCSP123]
MKPGHVILGAAMVGAGALAPLWLPFGLVGGIALLALIRICWLEDNIISDLFGRDSLPPGYRNTAELRRLFFFRWFGILVEESMAEQSAHQMATAMRAEVQIWAALLLGLASTLVVQTAPFGLLVNAGVGLGLFVVALARADRLAVSLAHCEAGRALPDHLLLPSRRRILAERKR